MKFKALASFLVALCLIGLVEATPAGISYSHLERKGPLSIHVLEVDPALCRLELATANDEALGLATVLELAEAHQALAAINTGFFEMEGPMRGLPSGVLCIDGCWLAPALRPRGALGWGDGGRWALFGRLLTEQKVTFGSRSICLDTFNAPRGSWASSAFLPSFHSATPLEPEGLHLIVQRDRVVAKVRGANCLIPSDGWVLSIGKDNPLWRWWQRAPLKARVALTITPLPQIYPATERAWLAAPNIIGGTPLLILNGKIRSDYGAEELSYAPFFERHPRTAAGIRKDGTWIFAVVDGRQSSSRGMTLEELSQLMLELGCVAALNLDGGGSTTMCLEGSTMNSPSDGHLRPVSNAILILPR